MVNKLDKILSYGVGIFGVILGIQLADSITPRSGEAKVLTIGKEAAGGIIFGAAGFKAGHAAYEIIPKFEKGVIE